MEDLLSFKEVQDIVESSIKLKIVNEQSEASEAGSLESDSPRNYNAFDCKLDRIFSNSVKDSSQTMQRDESPQTDSSDSDKV